MNWIAPTLAAFGDSLGIQGLTLDVSGTLELELQPGGRLRIVQPPEHESTDMLVTLIQPVPRDGGYLRAALMAVDLRRVQSGQGQVAIVGQDMVFTIRIARHAFVIHTLEEAIGELLRMHELAQS